MRVKSELASYVEEQLAFLGRLSTKSIFGGIGIFVDERLLGIVMEDKLYLHTDASNLRAYQERGMPQFKPYPNAFDLTTDHPLRSSTTRCSSNTGASKRSRQRSRPPRSSSWPASSAHAT